MKMMEEEIHDRRDKRSSFDYMSRQIKVENTMAIELPQDDSHGRESSSLNQNSLIWIQDHAAQTNILYVPAYLRCHFRTMTEMDIQNLSSSFYATMNIAFYLGKYSKGDSDQQKRVSAFAQKMHEILKQNLKITFQNDFVLNLEEDISSNVSDSDRLIRTELTSYENDGINRYYSNMTITRKFKFGLHSDIFFFPLEQNILDLVTTLNQIKIKIHVNDLQKQKEKEYMNLIIRFNCMNLEIGDPRYNESMKDYQNYKVSMENYEKENRMLVEQLKELYMLEHHGKELTADLLYQNFVKEDNHPFFRNIKISFPLKQNATQFGYYNIIQRDVKINYTRNKQLASEQSCYQRFKACIFCSKEVINFDEDQDEDKRCQKIIVETFSSLLSYQEVNSEDRSKELSFCNAIMKIPLLKASLGTIIQLCIPIFFLSFLTLVEFLYATSTTLDQVRGQKIGSSTLIVATYISFIYLMRTVIPPTPSWSLFEVAVCLLAALCLFPIFQSIYESNINNVGSPFGDGLFIASFFLIISLCALIVMMLIVIKFYMARKIKRYRSTKVQMDDLLSSLTKKYFHIWRNSKCKYFMINQINYYKNKKCIVKVEK